MADFCTKLSNFKLSEEGQKVYKDFGQATFYSGKIERILIGIILEKEGFENNICNIMNIFKTIGKLERDRFKHKLFFENTTAHFI